MQAGYESARSGEVIAASNRLPSSVNGVNRSVTTPLITAPLSTPRNSAESVPALMLMVQPLNGRGCYTRLDLRPLRNRGHDLGEPRRSTWRNHNLLDQEVQIHRYVAASLFLNVWI